MYLGRFHQGDEIYVTHQCTLRGTRTPNRPTAAPYYQVFRTGTPSVILVNSRMAAYQPGQSTGLFRLSTFLGNLFETEGNYGVIVRWLDSDSNPCEKLYTFELIPGGSATGAILSMAEVVRPDARYILCSTDSGEVFRRKNPR